MDLGNIVIIVLRMGQIFRQKNCKKEAASAPVYFSMSCQVYTGLALPHLVLAFLEMDELQMVADLFLLHCYREIDTKRL